MRASIRSLLVSGAAAALLVSMPSVASASDSAWAYQNGSVTSATATYSDATNSVTVKDLQIDYLVPTLDVWRLGSQTGTHYPCATRVDGEVLTCAPINVPENTIMAGKLCMYLRGTGTLHGCGAITYFTR